MLEIKNITYAYTHQTVLKNISLNVEAGEILCLPGPSGCGKTTLLRVITGLETGYSGDVLLNQQSIKNVPVHERGFGFMFQDYALFPHMNVAQNVAFGLRMHHHSTAQQQKRVHEVLDIAGLSGFEKRDVNELSGGEKQRVALARSLAPQPRLLMLDEPLGSLDALLRERLIVEIRDIIKSTGLTAIYVTHDRHEAFAIADRIALMNAGQIEQIDTPENLYFQPQTIFSARFLGLNNIIPVLSIGDSIAHTPLGNFKINGKPDALLLHPDYIHLQDTGNIRAQVTECVFQGDSYRLSAISDNGLTLGFKVPSTQPAPAIHSFITIQADKAVELSEKSVIS